ncbi:MarR family transcriptional regulator [Streptomyces sp. NBC_00237]|uniref:helix-turn-helix domain-containing protein n=1 Tax=Streptomyces sp. NBC_00237 TaxID=2975687 RepID=UPI00225882ED|nr:helix-turn-helix domain-containing protein [Streptomyces sp. NBC_00237]MCX5204435.1 MarR family transcriptional regulator [Streptomyces sp. NBC_00237]
MSAARGFDLLTAMLALEREHPGPLRLAEIADRAGLSSSQANKLLAQATARGLVVRPKYGMYRLASTDGSRAVVPPSATGPLVLRTTREVLRNLQRQAGASAVALHVPQVLPGPNLLCNLVDITGPPATLAPVLEQLAHQQPKRTAAGRAMLALMPGKVTPHHWLPPEHQLSPRHVAAIRGAGVASHRCGEWESLATVIRSGARFVGALTIIGPRSVVGELSRWAEPLKRAAAQCGFAEAGRGGVRPVW